MSRNFRSNTGPNLIKPRNGYIACRKKEKKNYILFPVIIILFSVIIILFLFSVWNSANLDYVHTYMYPANSPGLVTDNRFGLFWFFSQVAILFRLSILILSLVRFTKPKSKTVRISYITIAILFCLEEIIFLVIHIIEIGDCNQKPFNVCNDYRYCCVFGTVVLTLPIIDFNPFCPLVLSPCSPAVTAIELDWSTEFKISFSLNCIFVVLGIISIIASILSPEIKKDSTGWTSTRFKNGLQQT